MISGLNEFVYICIEFFFIHLLESPQGFDFILLLTYCFSQLATGQAFILHVILILFYFTTHLLILFTKRVLGGHKFIDCVLVGVYLVFLVLNGVLIVLFAFFCFLPVLLLNFNLIVLFFTFVQDSLHPLLKHSLIDFI